MVNPQDQKTEMHNYTKMSDDIYDAGNTSKDYKGEAALLKKFISKFKQTEGKELLDVGCGTGLHLQYLINDFVITGIDISEQQLEGARKRLPNVTFLQGDMRNFNLYHRFDVVACLYSGIAHVQPYREMEKAVKNMARHLKPGGVLFVEPWLQLKDYDPNQQPQTYVGHLPNKNVKIKVKIFDHHLEDNIATMSMHHIVEKPEGIEEFTEKHSFAMYSIKEYMTAFKNSGLSVRHDKEGLDGRGMFIGIKSAQKVYKSN